LEQIRTFLAVASREHVTHAAQVLRLSQPAVTQQVQLLERALGVRLLERIGRSVRLTGAGAEVAGACLLVMRALENLNEIVQAVRGLDLGSVSIGASQLAATYFLPTVLSDFVAAHPRINLGVVVGDADDVCHQVASGQLECGLVDGVPTEPAAALVRAKVAATDVVIVTNPQHKEELSRDLRDENLLQRSRYLVWDPESAVEVLAEKLLGEHYECTPRLQIGSLEAARRSLLQASGFIAAMPVVAVQDELGSGALVRLGQHTAALPMFAVRRSGPDSPALEALWQALIRTKTSTG
jgi:DNA-binding transcriptional LysR family regulator